MAADASRHPAKQANTTPALKSTAQFGTISPVFVLKVYHSLGWLYLGPLGTGQSTVRKEMDPYRTNKLNQSILEVLSQLLTGFGQGSPGGVRDPQRA